MSDAVLAAALQSLDARLRVAKMLLATAAIVIVASRLWPAAGAINDAWLMLLGGGLVAGLLAGLLGIGGALVTLPVLYAALPHLGVPAALLPATAVSTALMAMLPTTLVAAWRQHRRGALHVRTLGALWVPMMAGAIGGACVAAWINGPLLALMFAAQSLFYGTCLLTKGSSAEAAEPAPPSSSLIGRYCAVSPWLACPPLAAFCACVGMGGGSMVTPYLHRRGLEFRSAVATASALNLCIALGGMASVLVMAQFGPAGHTPSAGLPMAALVLGLAAVVTVPVGVALAHRLPMPMLRRGVGLVNLAAALTLVGQLAR